MAHSLKAFIERKQSSIEHNEKMIKWLKEEIDTMKHSNSKDKKLANKLHSYEWNLYTRLERIKKHKKDIEMRLEKEKGDKKWIGIKLGIDV